MGLFNASNMSDWYPTIPAGGSASLTPPAGVYYTIQSLHIPYYIGDERWVTNYAYPEYLGSLVGGVQLTTMSSGSIGGVAKSPADAKGLIILPNTSFFFRGTSNSKVSYAHMRYKSVQQSTLTFSSSTITGPSGSKATLYAPAGSNWIPVFAHGNINMPRLFKNGGNLYATINLGTVYPNISTVLPFASSRSVPPTISIAYSGKDPSCAFNYPLCSITNTYGIQVSASGSYGPTCSVIYFTKNVWSPVEVTVSLPAKSTVTWSPPENIRLFASFLGNTGMYDNSIQIMKGGMPFYKNYSNEDTFASYNALGLPLSTSDQIIANNAYNSTTSFINSYVTDDF